jgi:hypothetical protein
MGVKLGSSNTHISTPTFQHPLPTPKDSTEPNYTIKKSKDYFLVHITSYNEL